MISHPNGFQPSKGYPAIALQLFVIEDADEDVAADDPYPRNLDKIGHLNIAGALHPVVLADGPLLTPAEFPQVAIRSGERPVSGTADAPVELVEGGPVGPYRPADMVVWMHLCRGNFRSMHIASGGYDPVAEVLFNTIDVDAYFMEYDTGRAGTFAPLRFVPKGKTVVLGLVTSKTGQLESKDALKRRIEEAARMVPLDQLAISPQCGFASTEEGNLLTVEEQWAKLSLCVEVAQEVWGGV